MYIDDEVSSILTGLIPFFTSICFYFVLVTRDPEGLWLTTTLKCFPVLALMLFIKMHKMDRYCLKIFLGLVFSFIGDALLNIDLIPQGMAAFGLTHICYILAFGLEPLKLHLSVIYYALGITLWIFVNENLDEVLEIGLPVYAFVLTTMAWRSLVQACTTPNIINILCAFGSFMFCVSDGIIAIDMFYVPLNARVSFFSMFFFSSFLINAFFCSTT
ncbi:TMEM86A family protein [Megaselia abdita]